MKLATRTVKLIGIAVCAIVLMGNEDCFPERPCRIDADCAEGEVCIEGTCTEDDDVCVCPEIYAPVCGLDGETYSNRCEADCADTLVTHEGECESECPLVLCVELCPYGYIVDDDGCETCDCAEPPLCMDDGDCPDDHYCNTDVCLSPCDDEPGATCPAVCYGVCEAESCSCPDVWEPVCGVDGDTYGNSCEARCAGVVVEYRGECEDDCICTAEYAPVCGVDGETYGNTCRAACAGVEIAHRGECEDTCICTEEYAPVCGVDGNTYSNACFAGCAGVRIAYRGECEDPYCWSDDECDRGEICEELPCDRLCTEDAERCCPGVCVPEEPCGCPDVWEPVCGVDGRTYSNSCVARCARVEIAYEGDCTDVCWSDDECDEDQHCEFDDRCLGPPCTEDDPHCGCPGVCVADEPCVCTADWNPVCGVDGRTYGNACVAECAGVEIAHRGECERECRSNEDCPRDEICYPPEDTCQPICYIACFRYDPVCGTDGNTYGCGQEDAWCHGVEVAYEGECHELCVCPDIWAPVCGVDGNTYGNRCEARCAGVDIAHEGACRERECRSNEECPGDLICYPGTNLCQAECAIMCFAPDPVCGVDGNTYWCGTMDAWCHGVEVAYDGECREEGCWSDDDCERGEYCDIPACDCDDGTDCRCPGVCVPSDECWSDDECERGEICEELPCDRLCLDDTERCCPGICVPDEPCACFDLWDPVCGVDGKTYSNDCYARCAGVEVAYEGECRDYCWSDDDCSYGEICDLPEGCLGPPCSEDDPTCGCPGVCVPDPCACPRLWAPVCGEDGNTYANSCEAGCAGVAIAYEGECREIECRSNADCPDDLVCDVETHICRPACEVDCFRYEPVCGTDGVTYGCGKIDAHCHGVEVAYEGECRECAPVLCDLYCEFGWALDDAGCEICACADPPRDRYCLSNADCEEGLICDTENYCLGVGDLTVCYGACVRR